MDSTSTVVNTSSSAENTDVQHYQLSDFNAAAPSNQSSLTKEDIQNNSENRFLVSDIELDSKAFANEEMIRAAGGDVIIVEGDENVDKIVVLPNQTIELKNNEIVRVVEAVTTDRSVEDATNQSDAALETQHQTERSVNQEDSSSSMDGGLAINPFLDEAAIAAAGGNVLLIEGDEDVDKIVIMPTQTFEIKDGKIVKVVETDSRMKLLLNKMQQQQPHHQQQQQQTVTSSFQSMSKSSFIGTTSNSAAKETTVLLQGMNHHPLSSYMDSTTTTSYEAGRRQVSSVIIAEEFLGPLPTDMAVKYVEVPVVEEVTRRIPKKEVIEVEKVVPKYEYEFVDRVVETPRIEFVDRQVEVPRIVETVRHVPIKQIQEVPREVIKTVPKIEYVTVEKIVEVPGQVVEVPKPYTVERLVPVKRWVDRNTPVVVAQTIRPIVTESHETIDVDVYEYEPQVIPIDVHVAKPVSTHLMATGVVDETHQYVTVPAAQYNTILKAINIHYPNDMVHELPYRREGNTTPFLSQQETPGTAVPITGVTISSSLTTPPNTMMMMMQEEARNNNETASQATKRQISTTLPSYRQTSQSHRQTSNFQTPTINVIPEGSVYLPYATSQHHRANSTYAPSIHTIPPKNTDSIGTHSIPVIRSRQATEMSMVKSCNGGAVSNISNQSKKTGANSVRPSLIQKKRRACAC